MGLTTNGLEIRRLPEVIADLVTSLQTNINPNINVDDDALLGQINTIFAEYIASQEELAQAVYDSFNVLTAEGKNLDDLAALIGITRSPAIASFTSSQQFTGNEGAVIPIGTLLQNPITGIRYVTTGTELILSIEDCSSGTIEVQSVLNSTAYSFNVNVTTYSFTSDASATRAEILAGLQSAVAADANATWTATVVGDRLVVTSQGANISLTSLVNLLPVKATNTNKAAAQNTGIIETPLGVVNSLVIPVVDSTVNLAPYTTGRAQEGDEEFRARLLTSQQIGGKATVEAITDTLLAIDEVTTARVIENNTSSTVDSIPAHSFESFVEGGTDAKVALAIWNTKPAGIGSYGTTSEDIVDSQGNPHTIMFTRPTVINLAFKLSYTVYDAAVFPVDGENRIAKTIDAYTDTLGLGVDIIPTRYFGPIYDAVAGINSLVLEVQIIPASGDAPNPANWQTTTLAIADKQKGKTELVDIEVVEV